MKKLLLILTVLSLLSSCGALNIPYRLNSYSIDYSKYTRDGFFITESNSVSFDYDPIASIVVSESTGYIKTNEVNRVEKNKIKEDSVYGTQKQSKKGNPNKLVYATLITAMDAAVEETKKLGGNSIIGIKITGPGNSAFPGYTVAGMAVKRK